MMNENEKCGELDELVEHLPFVVPAGSDNLAYLETKRHRVGQILEAQASHRLSEVPW